ncbi:MAG: translocation/assembly module TamB domain-containing protein [bacterium]|nr:MAG: translocation/assembly module TamB domain-containing protein [bacterium]
MVKRILKSKIMPWVSLLTGLLVTFFILLLLVIHTDFFALFTGRMFSNYLFRGTRYSLRMERISGNPLKGLNVEGLTVRYSSEDFSFDVIRVEKISLRYDILSFIKRERHLDEIVVTSPHLWIKPDTLGTLILPMPKGGEIGGFPNLTVDRFAIEDGQVIIQGDSTADVLQDVSLNGSLRLQRQETIVSIAMGSGKNRGREITLRGMNGQIRWVRDSELINGDVVEKNRLLLDDCKVVLGESSLEIGGVVNLENLSLHLKLQAEPLEVEEVVRAVAYETSHFGEIQGTFLVRGRPDSLHVIGGINGIFSGYAFSEFAIDLTWTGRRVEFNSYEGLCNGAFVRGKGLYAAGDPEILDLDLDAEAVDLSASFVPGREMPETDLTGHVLLTYYPLDGSARFSLDLERGGHFVGFPFENGSIDGRYGSDTLYLDRIELGYPTHTVSSNGWISDNGAMRFFFDLSCAREDTIFPYFNIEDYRSDLVLNGIWEGTFDAWDIRANGSALHFDYGNIFVPSGKVNFIIRKNDDYEVYFDLNGDSCHVAVWDFASPVFSIEYLDGVTHIKRLHLAREGFDAEMIGEIAADGDVTSIHLGEISILSLDEQWTSGGEFTVLIDDSTYRFVDLQLHSREGALYLDGTYNRASGRVDGKARFERLGMVLLNRAGLLSTPIDGDAEGFIDCHGEKNDPDVHVHIRALEGSFDTIPFDTCYFDVRYTDGMYTIDSLAVASRTGFLNLEGSIWGAHIDELYSDLRGSLRRSEVDMNLRCRDLTLSPILRPLGLGPFTGGSFTGDISCTDSLVHPELKIDGSIRDLSVNSFRIPSLDLTASIGKEQATFAGTIDVLSGEYGTFSGTIPMRASYWFYGIDRIGSISVQMTIPEGDISSITEMTDYFAEAHGRFAVGFLVAGTVENPKIIGGVDLLDAGFRIAGMEENFSNVRATVKIEDTLITITEMNGREGKEGSFSCNGWMTLRGWKPRQYSVKAYLDDFLIASIPDILSIVSGELSIGSRIESGRTIPVLGGNIEVKRAEVYYDLGELASREPSSTMAPPSWYAAVDLEVPGNTWLKTPDANVELQGRITLYHDQRGMYLRGRLNLIRGWYTIYNNKFRVRSGTLDFVHAGGFRPVVDIEAETRDPEGRKIFLNLTWTQDDVEPRLVLTHEDPGYSQTDIWKMLGGGFLGSAGGSGTSWDALSTAQSLAANYIERLLNSQMEGITIELESTGGTGTTDGTLGEKETMIAVGKYLSEGLYVKFKQGLSISTARQIEVEYRISDLFLLRSEIIRHSEKVLQAKSRRSTDEINVDIKLRWEF